MVPAAEEGLVFQQQTDQQGYPDLPSYSVSTVSEEVCQLQGLLDLFKEDLDFPSASVQIGHRGRALFKVIGQKNHFPFLSIDHHQSHDPTHRLGILFAGKRAFESDQIVSQNLWVGMFRKPFDHSILKIILGSSHPENPADTQIPQVTKIHIGSVEMTISPSEIPAHTSRARLASFSPAVSTIAKRGNKLCRFNLK